MKDIQFRKLVITCILATMMSCNVISCAGNFTSNESVNEEQSSTRSFSLEEVPAYNGEPSVQINGNNPYFTEKEKENTEAFENYHKLDELGRCGVAYANICPELMPTEERGAIGSIKPTGWHTVKYKGVVEGNYLYNRCHLIAYCLAGENDNKKNLITGTRYMNNEGMLPYEVKVAQYVEETGNHVLYRVTPVFEGGNLLASGVLMEAYSVEDQGKGIAFCIYVYNLQPGITINYQNGESERSEENLILSGNLKKQREEVSYILNTNTKKFHRKTCSAVAQTREKNKKEVKATREYIMEQGYTPCKNCNP